MTRTTSNYFEHLNQRGETVSDPLNDIDDFSVGMYDYEAPSHPIHENETISSVLAELAEISQLESVQRGVIDDLTRSYRFPSQPATGCNVISLKDHRDARKPNGGRS